MINSNFLTGFKRKVDKLDDATIKNLLFQLIEENESIKTIFNSMKEAVLVLDENMRISFYNKTAMRLLQMPPKNSIGSYLRDIITNKLFVDVITNAIIKEERIDEKEMLFESINPAYISFSLHPLVQNGKIIGSLIIIENITTQKENKNKLRHSESLAALITISAGIAHEIKNPLGALSIHVQLLEDEIKRDNINVSDDFKYSISVIKDEIDRLNNIVMDYLFTVRPLNAKLMLTNLKKFLDDFTDFIDPELKSKNILLKKKYNNLPDIWLDEKYFRQALLNLVKNSISAIKETGIIEIKAYQENNYVYIDIIDNGEGISEEDKHKIFDPYFTTKNFGTGLGLTIVYKIVNEHRGEITFSSGKGETIFTIKLPLSYIEKGQIEYSGENNLI